MSKDQVQTEDIDGDHLNSYLDRQIETYFHTQRRAERLIQLLIAASAIIITFTSEGVFNRVTNYLQSVENQSPIYLGDNIANLADLGTPLSLFVIMLSAIFLLDSIAWAIDVLTMPRLNSLLGAEKSYSTRLPLVSRDDIEDVQYGVNTTYNDKVRSDLKFNSNLLGKMGLYMSKSYERLLLALALLVPSMLLVFADLTQDPFWIISFCSFCYVLAGSIYIVNKLVHTSWKNLELGKKRLYHFIIIGPPFTQKYGFHGILYIISGLVAFIGYTLSFLTTIVLF